MADDQNQLQQGQDLYVQGEEPVPAEEELTQIAPPDTYEQTNGEDEEIAYEEPPPPPLSPMERLIGGAKRFFIPFVLIILAIVLVSFLWRFIGGGGPTPSKEANLTYWLLWEDEQVFAPLIEDFQKENPKVTITVVKQTPREYRERLENAILRGEGPDIFRFHNTWLPMLIKKGIIASVPEKVMKKEEFESMFYPVVTNDLKMGDEYYGIPLTFDALGLFYNKSILQAAGVTPPKSWQELRDVVNELTVRDTNGQIRTAGIALGTTNNVEFWPDILGMMILQNSGDIINPQGDQVADALLFYDRFSQQPDNVWDETLDNSILAFAGEKVAMIFAPSWIAHDIHAINPNLDFSIAPVPQLPEVNVAWAHYWAEGVNSKSKNQEEAFLFLKFLIEKDNLVRLYTEESKTGRLFGEPYSRTDLAIQLKGDPYLDAIVSQGPYARSGYLSSRTFDNGLNDRIIKYYEDAVNNIHRGSSPQSAINTARQGISEVLSDFGLIGQ